MDRRTRAQKKAIETINQNLAVSAGAGTGKTKVLTERYIEILEKGQLEEGKEVESIVAITFTKKATQEMRERIRESIRSKFGLDRKWKRFYRDMEKANISTIHSFCGNILRENPLESEVDPLFEILEETRGRELLERLTKDTLFEKMEEDKDLYRLLRVLNHDEIDDFADDILYSYQKVRANGQSIREVKDKTLGSLTSVEIPDDIDRFIIEDFQLLMEETRSNSKFNKLKQMNIWKGFLENRYLGLDRLEVLREFQDYIGSNKKNEDIVERLEENIALALLSKETYYEWAYKVVFSILEAIDKKYSREKDKYGLLDYNDLEHKTYILLRDNREIRKEYQEKYRYIMVDEFQDTNNMQKDIFYSLSSREQPLDRENLFVVGDPKQSIYGFRGADLRVFEDTISDMELVNGSPAINMTKNFRSVDFIINFVNEVFSPLMEDYISLNYHHKTEDKKEIEVIETENLNYPEDIGRADYDRFYEAGVMADRIRELVESGDYSYGDFAFLFRARTNDWIYEEALRSRDIPYYNADRSSLYQREEILDLINGLKAISSRYDSLSIIGFLRSPMVGLNDESIYRIISGMEEQDLYKTLEKTNLDSEEEAKKRLGLDILKKYHSTKDIYGVSFIIEGLIRDSDYMELALLYDDGEQRFSNIHKFLKIARTYEEEEKNNLDSFLSYLSRMQDTEGAETQARIKSEKDNVVKIMTIHKSKGLQFPVVLLPELSRSSRFFSKDIIYNKDMGLGLRYEPKASLYEEIKRENMKKNEEEMKRILYVGMTRAEKMLILGSQGNRRGFKKFLEGLDKKGNIRYLNYEFREAKEGGGIRPFRDRILNSEAGDLNLSNILEFDNHEARSFPSVNISQFIEYNWCKRKFYYEYYKPLPDIFFNQIKGSSDNILSPLDRGNIVHKFAEVYREGENIEALIQKLVESFNYDFNSAIKRELDPFIENYLTFASRDYDKAYNEESFYLKIEDTYISGIIDRIYIKKDKAYLYDFKTNTMGEKEDLKKFYSPQLQLYTYAVEKLLDVEVAFAGIVFLADGEIVAVDIDRQTIDNNLKRVREFVAFIENHDRIESYSPRDECGSCIYKMLCED